MSIFYLDYLNGNDANTGVDWANAWKTLTGGPTAARIAPADVIRIAKSPDTTSLGQSATWTNLSRTVTLTSAVTLNIELCNTAWTASANVTCTASTIRKEGTNSASQAIASGFTTGKIAYKALAGSTDFSAYQQVSFWIRSGVAIASGVLTLNLCSDATGDVSVNSIAIPAIPAIDSWQVVTVDTAGALGSAIQSVSLNAISDPATVTVLIDDILACKASSSADSLTLSSLISKNNLSQGGTEGFWGIKNINGTAIELDQGTNSGQGVGRGYSGTTETIATYKRETIKTTLASSAGTIVQEIMDSGSNGNNIQFQGGWDTGSATQNGETFFDGQNGNGYGIFLSNKAYNTLNYISIIRYGIGIFLSGATSNTLDTISNANNNTNSGIYFGSGASNNIINNIINANSNVTAGVGIQTSLSNVFTEITNANSNQFGVYLTTSSNTNTFTTITNANNNSNSNIYLNTSTSNTFDTISNANAGVIGVNIQGTSNFNTFNTISNINNNTSAGLNINASYGNLIGTVSSINTNSSGVLITSANNNTINTIGSVNSNTNGGIGFSSSSINNRIGTITSVNSNTGIGINFSTSSNYNNIGKVTACNSNTTYGVAFQNCNQNNINWLSTTGNTTAGILVDYGINFVRMATIAETTKVTTFSALANGRLYSDKDQQTAYAKIYTDGGNIVSQASTLTNGSGTEWKFTTASTVNRTDKYPLILSVAKIAVTANNLVTVKIWCKKGHATNIGAKLVCRGYQIAGVDNDVVATKANDTAEEELTITFTPTEAGVVELEMQAYYIAGHSTVIVDKMTVTQA